MIIKNIFKINKITYLVILIFFLTGSFHLLFFITTLLLIHELGHFLTAKIFGIKVDRIYIYPFGGIAKFYLPLNYSILKEFIILVNGPIFQEICKIVLIIIFPRYQEMIIIYHYSILLFNLLPIYPLDGGKLLNLILELFNPYKKSFKISIIISYLFIFLLLIININSLKLNVIIMILFLMYKVSVENKYSKYKYELFLLERYINNYNFKNSKIINNVENFYRNNRHLLKINNEYTLEKEYLHNKYKKK